VVEEGLVVAMERKRERAEVLVIMVVFWWIERTSLLSWSLLLLCCRLPLPIRSESFALPPRTNERLSCLCAAD
jgi:hypothetical protein